MLEKLASRIADPDRTILHRAIRVAIVLPLLLFLGLHVLHDPQFALVASFGSFAALAMADFMGPRASRLRAHAGLALAGVVLVALGTALSNTLWPAVIAMLAIGVAAQFVMALGGQFALGNNAGLLAFVVSVMVPAGDDAILSRVAGWLVAMAASALFATFLWPRHERRDLYLRVDEACRALGAIARASAEGGATAEQLTQAHDAIERVREVQRSLGFRQIGPPGHQRALLGLVDALGQGFRFSLTLGTMRSPTDADRELARSVARTLDAVGAVMQVCSAGRVDFSVPAIDGLVKARHEHRVLLDATAARAIAAHAPGQSMVSIFSNVFPIRVLSYVTLGMCVDALVITGHPVSVHDDFVVIEPATATTALRHAADVLGPHLSPGSVWFHNCVRAGLALALSVLVAKVTDIGHAFWVVLATLSVLRSNVSTTGATVMSAIAGTFAGFLLATGAITVLGPHPLALWLALPVTVFLAGYAPYAISFGAGQAMFALLVVALFNLMVPDGWVVGVARVEAVAVGAVVALVASLIMWPKGASSALRSEIAAHVRAARTLVERAFDALVGRADAASVERARVETMAARRRADEALAAYIGERGAKRVPLADWGWLARLPVVMRGAADAAAAMHGSGYMAIDRGVAAEKFDEAVKLVMDAYGEIGARLEHPDRAKEPALAAAVKDFDMIDGAGARRDAILAAADAWVDAHRDEPDIVHRVMALAWGVGWLGYLAHLRVVTEAPLDDVVTHAGMPWWK